MPVPARLDFASLRRPDGTLLLALFLAVDVAIVGLHLALKLIGTPAGDHFDLGVDRSYGEMLMYIKLGWISALAFLLARRRRSPVFASLALGSLILLLEDALILHERIGWHLRSWILELIPGLNGLGILSLQIGELLWLGALTIVIGCSFVVSVLRADPVDRRDALSIGVFFAAVAFFAVVVDTVHSLFAFGSVGDLVFTVIEDGGELIALSPAVALSFALVSTSRGVKSVDQDSTAISETALSDRRPRQRA